MSGHHAHRIPGEPSRPDSGVEFPRCNVVWQVAGTVMMRRIAGGHAPVIQQRAVARFGKGRSAAKVFPEPFKRAMIVVPQGSNGLRKVGEVTHLEQRVTGMRSKATPQIWSEHPRDHGSVAAAPIAR